MASGREAKEWAREHMKGLWTSPMYPFTADFQLDEAGIRNNVEYMIKSRAAGLGFGFSEPWVCSHEERRRAIEVAVDAVRGRVPAYIHTTDHSVEETIALTNFAKAAGADAVMIWPPYEWAKSQTMVAEFYEYVASKVDMPIFLYNTYHSGMAMSVETITRLARVENICALKDAINDAVHTVQVAAACGDQIVVSDPLEEHLLNTVLHFNQQILLGTTPVFMMQSPYYQPIQEYYELARAGKAAEAAQKYYALQPLRDVWTAMYAVLWDKKAAQHPLPYIKYWMDLIGMSAGPVRPPMKNLTGDQKAWVREKLMASGWVEKLWPDRVDVIRNGF